MVDENKTMENDDKIVDPGNEALSAALNLSFRILKVIMVILVLLFLVSGSFTVEHNEVAMVLRFGEIVGTKADRILTPGFHWTWPFPISEVVRVKVGKRHSLQIKDFKPYKEDEKEPPSTLQPEKDGYTLTKDGNIIHFSGNIEYDITDPYSYKILHNAPKTKLKNIICNWIVKASTQFTLYDILKDNPDRLRTYINKGIQRTLDRYNYGIKIINVNINGKIPLQVKDSFERATQAQSERNQSIIAARTYEAELKNKTAYETENIINIADNYARLIEKEAEGDAQSFTKIVEKFKEHPDIFIQRRYQETMEKISQSVQEIFLLSTSAQKQRLQLRLNRNPELYRLAPSKEE